MKLVSLALTVVDDETGAESSTHDETFDLETLIGTSQDAEDGCDPCEFGTELLDLIINMSKELD
jgi:hypothetical protein